MFTGIIEEVGALLERQPEGVGARLRIAARRVLEGVAPGASIAVSGVCLTLARRYADSFSCDLSEETLARSTLGGLERGARVNLERALALGDRLGGHLVQGHVDGIGTVRRIEKRGGGAIISFVAPPALRKYIAAKGSIAVDGVSLTVAELLDDGFSVAVIPTTWEMTICADYRAGSRVNLETDLLARYLERLLAPGAEGGQELTWESLAEEGFM